MAADSKIATAAAVTINKSKLLITEVQREDSISAEWIQFLG